MKKFTFSYQLHGIGIKEVIIYAETKRDADWKFLSYLECQHCAIFYANVIKHFIDKIHVNVYGDICISFRDVENKENFCTVYPVKTED